MKIKYLTLLLTFIFFGCNEPEVLSCPGGQIEDQCGVCCGGDSNLECSDEANTGVMDACGTCFGEIQDEDECMGLCTDPEAGNYNQQMYSLECPCDYNSSLEEISCCTDGEEGEECDDIIGPNQYGKCYILTDNELLKIDLKFLTEENFCTGDAECNNLTNRECCEMIPNECPYDYDYDCEWSATFTTKSCRPIYFTNTSTDDISITTNSSNNELWNNFLNGDVIPAGTVFDSDIHTFYLKDVCSQIDTEENIFCDDYDNKNACNHDGHCNWYESYDYIIGNISINGAFQSSGKYTFCRTNSDKCGEIIIE